MDRAQRIRQPVRKLQTKVVVHGQRCVVTESGCLMDGRHHGTFRNAARCDLIVDSPSDVFGPSLPSIAPPCVGLAGSVGLQLAESIHPPEFIKNLGQPRALFRQKSRVLKISFPVFQVNLFVSDVPVAANHNFPTLANQVSNVLLKMLHELKLCRLP